MTGVPFNDLLIAIERDPNDASDKLRNAIRDGSCSMDEAMTGLREVAADADRARNPAVVVTATSSRVCRCSRQLPFPQHLVRFDR